MRRYTAMLVGAAAAALLPFGAYAQIDPNDTMFATGGLDVDSPEFNMVELAGPNTTMVDISAGAGTFAAAEQVDIDVVVFIHDADGVVQITNAAFESVNGGSESSAGDGSFSATVDFSGIAGLQNAINTARAFVGVIDVAGGGLATAAKIGIVTNDQSANGAETLLDLDDESMNEVITIDDMGPVLTQVLRDGDTRFIFVFDDEVGTNSVLGNLDFADFQSSTTMGGMFADFSNAVFMSNATVVGPSNGVALQLTIDASANLAPAIGSFARIALPDNGNTTNDSLVDIAENVADMQDPIQIEGVTAPTIMSADWVETVPTNGGPVANALKITMSGALSAAGDTTFWNGIAFDGGGAADLTVTAAALDSDPSCVLLTVSSPGGGAADGVAADGLSVGDTDGEAFEIEVDAMTGTPPTDILGTDFTGTATLEIGDNIVPTITSDAFTVDSDGDGVIDGFGFYFSEPLDIGMIDEDGFTLTKVAQTVHPFALFIENLTDNAINDPFDAMNEADVEVAGDDSDEFTDAITGFSLNDEDPDGSRLEMNNCLIISFDSSMVDWDNDMNSGDDDTDGESTPGTLDFDFADIDIVAAMAMIKDADGNFFEDDTNEDPDDGAGPVAVRVEFSTGDNVAGGMQKPSEQDGNPGDSDTNNTAFIVFNEDLSNGGVDPTAFRFGSGPNERFMGGDFNGFSGDGGNIAEFEDNSGGGFMPGLDFTITDDNGVEDGVGNAYLGTGQAGSPMLVVLDASAPYVLLQSDINGNTIHSAFLGGVDDDGFATTVTMTFSRDIKEGTEGTVDDWDIEGVGSPSAVDLDGNLITLTFPGGIIGEDEVVEITYLGGDISDPLERISAADGTMAAVAEMDDSWDARSVPQPDVDGEFMAVLDIAGAITGLDGESMAPAGTKIFGMIAVPTAKSATFTMGGVRVTVDGSSSMEAITNRLLGISANLYIIVEGPDMYFSNYKDDNSDAEAVISVNLLATNLGSVTFTGTGSFLTGSGTPVASISQGTVRIGWDVLRSDEGNAADLFDDGFEMYGEPLVSSAVVSGDDGSYLLHMTAPISAFNARLNANGWPVIIVVELPDGDRYAVSSLLNAIDLLGPITFRGLQRQMTPFDSDANITFNPNLANVGVQCIYEGWNALAFDRNSGWRRTATGPIQPAGVTNIVTATAPALAATHPLDQFVYFWDDNGDGAWTSDDDNDRLDSIIISSRCLDFFTFVLDSTGVKTGDNITAIFGGYATGVFNPEGNDKVGVFQFGPTISASTVFSALTGVGSFPSNATTLGWSLVTSPVSTENLTTFLTNNGSDFLIIFDRSGNNDVDIATFNSTTGGDAEEIEQGDALFLHKAP